MRAKCEGNWSPQTSQFSRSFGNGDDLSDGEVMVPTPAARITGYPTILHASAELPSGREWLTTGSKKWVLGCYPPRKQRKYAELTRGGTIQGQSCHKEHPMFRVSAPPKPQTPGPSRLTPPAPHKGRQE